MAKIVWDAVGEKKYELGVDHAVLYPEDRLGEYRPGVAWNGITQVAETPEGAEPQDQYADNIKYLSILSAEDLNGTIEAYTYPDEWSICDGSIELATGVMIGQQERKSFGLCYRTKIGNDVENQNLGYKLHLLYGAKASPSERTYETINDSPEPITFSWEFSTTPVPVSGHLPTALLTIDSTKVSVEGMARLEEILYGSDAAGADEFGGEAGSPRLPMPDEVMALLKGDMEEARKARRAGMVQGAIPVTTRAASANQNRSR